MYVFGFREVFIAWNISTLSSISLSMNLSALLCSVCKAWTRHTLGKNKRIEQSLAEDSEMQKRCEYSSEIKKECSYTIQNFRNFCVFVFWGVMRSLWAGRLPLKE